MEQSVTGAKHGQTEHIWTLLPSRPGDLVDVIEDVQHINPSVLHQIQPAADSLYSRDYTHSVHLCEALLDKIWEELNTGYWMDVHLCWRQAYSVVSVIKAVALSACLSQASVSCDHMAVVKTCDMGLLMGCPVLNNILARLSTQFQQELPSVARLSTQFQQVFPSFAQGANICRRKTDAAILDTKCKGGCNGDHQDDMLHRKKAKLSNVTGCTDATKCLGPCDQTLNRTEQLCTQAESVSVLKDQDSEGKTKDFSTGSPLQDEPVVLPPKIQSQVIEDIPQCSCPSVELFQTAHFKPGLPVVITEAINYWPALTTRRWSVEYLRSVAGFRTVPVEIGTRYTEDSWTQKLMTVNEMIDTYITAPHARSKAYLAQHQLFDQVWELRDDISVPVYCCLGQEEDVDINAWFGPAGTVSPLHQDPKHNFLCQVMGKKYVRLYSPDHTDSLYPYPTRLLHNTSQIDLDSPDLSQFPKFRSTPCLEFVLTPGDMLYIPPGYWHYLKSLSVSFSVSFWWQ